MKATAGWSGGRPVRSAGVGVRDCDVYTNRVVTIFEWNETKRLTNLSKHKLDFAAVGSMFDGRPTVTATSKHDLEKRFVTTSVIDGKLYTTVWTWREDCRRIISFRRARDGEERAYRQAHG